MFLGSSNYHLDPRVQAASDFFQGQLVSGHALKYEVLLPNGQICLLVGATSEKIKAATLSYEMTQLV